MKTLTKLVFSKQDDKDLILPLVMPADEPLGLGRKRSKGRSFIGSM